MRTIVITGASGFIGRHLLDELLRLGDCRIKILTRERQPDQGNRKISPKIERVEGDLHNRESLEELLEPGCIVINLVYLWECGEIENVTVIENLIAACSKKSVGRLVHVSTAAVVGRVKEKLVTEKTECSPVTEYGTTKLKVEDVIVSNSRNFFDTVILRPTAVFGIDGQPLVKLANDLLSKNKWINYGKSCLFGKRRMNLVHIDNVVAAIIFLGSYPNQLNGEVFIVSDDDDPKNNFSYVERFLMDRLGLSNYLLPKLIFPQWILSFLLRIRGRNNINPSCNYDASKLFRLGYLRPISFDSGLVEYMNWYCATHSVNSRTPRL